MQLDPPGTPLGMLQRGRGGAYLWALSAPREEARALLLRCIREDPRRDPQCDSLEDLYARIAIAIGLDLAPLQEEHREHEDEICLGCQTLLAIEPPAEEPEPRGPLPPRPAPPDLGLPADPDAAMREIEARLRSPSTPRWQRRFLSRALAALPPGMILAWAREHLGPSGSPIELAAAEVLSRHATPQDVPLLSSMVDGILSDEEWHCPCGMADALGHAGAAEALAPLRRIYEETTDTHGRRAAVEAMALLPGGVPPEIAREARHDAIPVPAPGDRSEVPTPP